MSSLFYTISDVTLPEGLDPASVPTDKLKEILELLGHMAWADLELGLHLGDLGFSVEAAMTVSENIDEWRSAPGLAVLAGELDRRNGVT